MSRSPSPRVVSDSHHGLWNKILLWLLCFYLFILCASFVIPFINNSRVKLGSESRDASAEGRREFLFINNSRVKLGSESRDASAEGRREFEEQDLMKHETQDGNYFEENPGVEEMTFPYEERPQGILEDMDRLGTIATMVICTKFLFLIFTTLVGILASIRQSLFWYLYLSFLPHRCKHLS